MKWRFLKRASVSVYAAIVALLAFAVGVSADITTTMEAYTDVITEMTDALGGWAPGVLIAVAGIALGLLGFNIGFRLIKKMVKG